MQVILYPNQIYQKQLISDLVKNFSTTSPNFQRQINWIHVEQIYNSIQSKFEAKQVPILSGVLQFVKVKNASPPVGANVNTIWLIDGNHRFQAYKKYYLDNPSKNDFYVIVNYITLATELECKNLFDQVNHVHPLQFVPDGSLKPTDINIIVNHFYNLYKPMFKTTNAPRRPCISFQAFQSCVTNALQFYEDHKDHKDHKDTKKDSESQRECKDQKDSSQIEITAESIIKWMTELNEKYCKTDSLIMDDLKTKTDGKTNAFETFKAKAQESTFAFGMLYKHDPLFLTSLVKQKMNLVDASNNFSNSSNLQNDLKDSKKRFQLVNKKDKVSKALKVQVWNNFFGESKRRGKCLLCQKSNLCVESFDLAHDLARSKGGKMTIENLFPCCSLCNKSMGTKTFLDAYQEMRKQVDDEE